MRVLWLIQSYEVHAFDVLADDLSRYAEVELVRLTAKEQDNLAETFKRFDFTRYDRVMTILRTKKEMRQWRAFRVIPNLVIFEYDACQNYIDGGKYQGKFSKHYRRLGSPRLIVSGAQVAARLNSEGFEAHFLPKGYDPRIIQQGSTSTTRDIPLAFVGRLKADMYKSRKAFIEAQKERHGLQVLQTEPGSDYADALSRIRIFVSADIGLGEYMAKNFEAMAAGCLLLTYSQGDDENQAVGFADMENVVLFRSQEEFDERLALLLSDPDLLERIARAGATFARENLAYDRMGQKLYQLLEPTLPERVQLSGWRSYMPAFLAGS